MTFVNVNDRVAPCNQQIKANRKQTSVNMNDKALSDWVLVHQIMTIFYHVQSKQKQIFVYSEMASTVYEREISFVDKAGILNSFVSSSFPVGCSRDKYINLLLERPIMAIIEAIEFKMTTVSQRSILPASPRIGVVELL